MRKASHAFLRGALLSVTALAISAPLVACGGSAPKAASTPEQLTPREVMQRFKPAIVRIENHMGARTGVGTGFFVTPEGRIATNLHVIAGGGILRVKLSDDSVHLVMRVVAIDQDRDLAIIEIDAPTKMPTLELGDSNAVEPGDAVIAVGNPMRLDYTVSDGLISSVRPVDDDVILQISAPISQGSSGGPLFNIFGQVIGVATAVSAEGQNLNFGVPVNYLKPLLAHDGGETVAEFAKRFKPRPRPSVITTDAGDVKREVPSHNIAILKDCTREDVLKVFNGIQRAIELGAPLYNDGDHQACFNIYEQTATHFEKDPQLCKGLRDSLGAGLLKAETQGDATHKAWVMRDTFDGLLKVIVELAQRGQ
jgi:hypothetical protein